MFELNFLKSVSTENGTKQLALNRNRLKFMDLKLYYLV